MSVKIIAAIDLNNSLGFNNELLCNLSNDMKHFRNLTENSIVVMGRKTYDSIGKALPNRINIILTRNMKYTAPVGTFTYNSLSEVIEKYQNQNNDKSDLWIIGGSEIYQQALSFANKIYLTIIDNEFEKADTYFPQFSLDDWQVTENIYNPADNKNEFAHYFVTYKHNKYIT